MSELDIRPLSPGYAVSPQIAPADMEAIAAAGFRTVICNRPDTEVSPDYHTARMAEAAEAAGLTYVDNPFGAMGLGLETIERQADAIGASDGPVLAYCRSGTRSATIWAFATAGEMPTDEIISALSGAGYPLDGLRPQIEAMANGR